MALEKTLVPVSFGKGEDTKSDPKQVVLGKFVQAQNVILSKLGQAQKRPGYVAKSTNVISESPITTGLGFGTRGDELVLFDGTEAYSYIEGQNKWADRTVFTPCTVTRAPVVRDGLFEVRADGTTHSSGFQLYAWEGSTGLEYLEIDTATGGIITKGTLDASGRAPKVLSYLGFVLVFWVSGGHLWYVNPSSGSAVDLGATGGVYDAAVVGANVVVAFTTAPGTSVTAKTIDSGLTVSAGSTVSPDTVQTLCVVADTQNSYTVFAYATSTAVKWRSYNAALTVLQNSGTFETVSNVLNITGVHTTGRLDVYYTVQAFSAVTGGIDPANYTIHSGATFAYGAGSGSVWLRGSALIAKAFARSSVLYVPIAHFSPLQSTCFLVDGTKRVVARFLEGVASGNAGKTSMAMLPESTPVSANLYRFALPEATGISGNTLTQDQGVSALSVDFADTVSAMQRAVMAEVLEVASGALYHYDGTNGVEHGFHLFPEGLTASVLPYGGSLGEGSYQYSATYEWADAVGRVHRSAPSVPVTALVPTTTTVTLTLTSGSAVATGVVGIGQLILGMTIAGTGIPVGTRVFSYTGATQINLSAAATASGTITATATYSMPHATLSVAGSNIVFDGDTYLYFLANATNGSALVTVWSTSGLAVGQTAVTPDGTFAAGTTISAINTTTKVVTMSTNATVTTAAPVVFQVSYQTSMTTTIGSASVTVSAAAATYAAQKVGARMSGTGISGTIVSASGTTVVMSAVATATGTNTATIWFPADIREGQLLTGTGAAGLTVASVSVSGGVTTATLAVPADPSAAAQTMTVTRLGAAQVTIPTLRLTSKRNVVVNLYRTAVNGVTFNALAGWFNATANDTTVDTVTVTDFASDYGISSNPFLYTEGGVFDNAPAPPCGPMGLHRGRLFVVDSTNPLTVYPSQEITAGAPLEFANELAITVDAQGGDAVTGIGSLDDKAVLFKETGIVVLSGDGPNATGGGQGWSLQAVATDVGCIAAKSVVRTPNGLMFQSAKGFYLLDRSLSVSYVGAPVEKWNGGITVRAAVLVPNTTQIRFVGNGDGNVLAYDYLIDQWTEFLVSDTAIDATVWNGSLVYLSSAGAVLEESGANDNGVFVPLRLETGWMSFAGIQGFQRVYRLLLLADWVSGHTLTVTVAYDWDDGITDTFTYAAPAAVQPYQLRLHLKHQKCQALKVTITDASNGDVGGSLSISSMVFEVGVKRGAAKLPASQSVGST